MSKNIKFIIPLAVFLILVAFFAAGLKLNPRDIPSPLINKPAPAFDLPVLSDNQKSFSSKEMQGKVWLLNVWASWCGACRDEHPFLMSISQKDGVNLIGLDYKDTDIEASQVLKSEGNPYKVVAVDLDGRTGINYGVYGVPETYLIDKSGVIRYKQTGPLTNEIFQEKIYPLIKGLQ
jgi:cytochrome c biogenesis protein CcmG/thiol:disulfide interchange protein DsbE